MPFKLRRVLAVILGVTEMLFFGGIMYGMNALFPVLQKELIFSDLCENKTDPNGCPDQVAMYANAFTTYSVVMMIMLVVVGILIDTIGLRLVNICSTIVYFIGMIMFAFLTPATSPMLFVSGTFAAVGGMGMMVCIFSVSQLFTKTSVIVLAFVTGSYDASSSLFAIVQITYNAGFPFRTTFLILAFCGLGMGLFTSCFILTYWLPGMATLRPGSNVDVELKEMGFEDEEENDDDDKGSPQKVIL